MTSRFVVGDVFDVLATLEAGSVDLILTSPPFLALRSYLPADHPDKGREIGNEPTPGAFIDTLLALSEEWARVLAPHGSLCVELGDTYSGAGGDWSDSPATSKARVAGGSDGGPSRRVIGDGWPLAKSLCLIPELYRISLVYGFNPLTGRTTPRWRARNVVRWCRPNPPVGALGDKFRPATSELVVACKSARRWFDLDAVRTEPTPESVARVAYGNAGLNPKSLAASPAQLSSAQGTGQMNPAGAPPLDWWQIPTEPYKGSHYATFPRDLCVRPIEAMCPREVCRICGQPRERITGEPEYVAARQAFRDGQGWGNNHVGMSGNKAPAWKVQDTLGWSDCGHDNYRPGLVLDPFAGSGTVLAVATGHGRDAIGVDLDARNGWLARERCGMLLDIDTASIDGSMS